MNKIFKNKIKNNEIVFRNKNQYQFNNKNKEIAFRSKSKYYNQMT